MSPFMRKACHSIIYVGEKVGLWDKGVLEAMNTMAVCVDSVVEGAREEIFSPCWWSVCRNVAGSGGVGHGDGIQASLPGANESRKGNWETREDLSVLMY